MVAATALDKMISYLLRARRDDILDISTQSGLLLRQLVAQHEYFGILRCDQDFSQLKPKYFVVSSDCLWWHLSEVLVAGRYFEG